MNTTNSAIESLLKSVIDARPMLEKLATDNPVIDYLRPALTWKKDATTFPNSTILKKIITTDIGRLYGDDTARIASEQLEHSWVIETGAHLHIPRRWNNAIKTDEAQINPLLFQGQVLWAYTNFILGNKLSISLNSGRVPLDNTNSGAYLDLPALKNPITLASKKYHPDSPQTLIPARNTQEITEKIELIEMYRKQKTLPENQYQIALEILNNFLKNQSSFSDQVATSHALVMNKVLPVSQITIDSEPIGLNFLIFLLEDKNSLIYSIFSDPSLRDKFISDLSNIRTGWSSHYSPFYSIVKKDEGYRLENYSGSLDPDTLLAGLKNKTIHPTGVMKFFALMAEAGICPSGGWTQSGYCTDIKDKGAKFLTEIGHYKKSEILKKIPTYVAAVGPCWALYENQNQIQLYDAITAILTPNSINMHKLSDITGNQALLIAAPTLYEFILEKKPPLSYNDLRDRLSFAFHIQDNKSISRENINNHIETINLNASSIYPATQQNI